MNLIVAMLAVALNAEPAKGRIAVLDMQDLSGTQATLVRQLSQVVVSEVAAHTDFKVISSAEITQVLGYEKQKELLGCTEKSCMAELAGALGVDYLLTSQLGQLGSRYRIDIRIADAQRSTILASQGDFVSSGVDQLADATVRFTRKVLIDAKLARADLTAPITSEPSTEAAPVAAVAQPLAQPSRTPAYLTWGAGALLLVGAAVMTAVTISTFNNVANPATNLNTADPSSLNWKGPLADGLWAGAIAAGGVGTYLYFSASPAPGSGGGLGVGGKF